MARGKVTGSYGPSRRSKKGGGSDANRWLGPYGDVVTLLMAFFVMLFAMSEVDIEKFNAFVSGLEIPFGNSASAEMLDALPSIVGEAGAAPVVPGDVSQEIDEGTGLPEVVVQELAELEEAVQEALADAGVGEVASFITEQRGLVISISADDVLFASGSTELSERGKVVIAAVTAPLRDMGSQIMVEGHTDDVPLERHGYTNWHLSTDRAVSVLTMMYAEVGVASERLAASGYGEFKPRVPNTDDRNRGINRRVDIVISPDPTRNLSP